MIIGVVGKPSVGKSTFFKALTLADVAIASYPFTTIKPNEGIGYVRVPCADEFFKVQCNPREGFCVEHTRFVPVKVIDVAGLVPGAHEGKGLGNQFLSDLNQADVLIHVVDASGSTNEGGESVTAGSYDPCNDIRFLEKELDMWYVQILSKGWEKFARTVQQERKDIAVALGQQLSGVNVNELMVKDAVRKLNLDTSNPKLWSSDDLFRLASELRRRSKPVVIAANKCDVSVARENVVRLKEMFQGEVIIPCSAESELALKSAAKHELIKYIPGSKEFTIRGSLSGAQKQGLELIRKDILGVFGSTGVQDVLDTAVFGVLKLIAIFPGGVNNLADKEGNVLPDCFLLQSPATALDFAFRIHSDLGEKFIRAIDVKTKRTVGKDHILKHGDVVEIVSGK